MIKTAKRNIRSSVFLLLIAAAALGSFGALSSGGRAAGQGNDKQSRAARSETGSTNDPSSKATKKNRTCKQVCDDTYYTCQKSAQPFPYNDWGQPGGCTYVHTACTQDCPSTRKQRKPRHLPKT